MSVTSENNKRIAKNTLFLYLRMLLIMGVTLYTSRVVLRVLGVEDFGIYSAVGGFVSMFAVISGSLTAAISRFITYEMGVGNTEKIARIFSVSVVIQLLISGIIVLFSETLGLWFLNMRMNIPTDRLLAANWVCQTHSYSAVCYVGRLEIHILGQNIFILSFESEIHARIFFIK